jgi:hypothetical protein
MTTLLIELWGFLGLAAFGMFVVLPWHVFKKIAGRR